VQNGNHIEAYNQTFPQLELIEPHAQRAFDLLVQHVETVRRCRPINVFRGGADCRCAGATRALSGAAGAIAGV